MSKLTWHDTREALSRLGDGEPRPKEAFWDAFKARAAELPRETPSYGMRPATGYGLRMAFAFACVAVVAGLSAVLLIREPDAAMAHRNNEIHSLEVTAKNNGVTILRDEASSSTILWIDDLKTE